MIYHSEASLIREQNNIKNNYNIAPEDCQKGKRWCGGKTVGRWAKKIYSLRQKAPRFHRGDEWLREFRFIFGEAP